MENIVPTEVQIKIAETKVMLDNYSNYGVATAEEYQGAGADLRTIKAKAKELTETRMSLTRPIEESKKKIIALFKEPLSYLEQAEAAIKKAMIGWQTKQEKIRQAEEARLAEIQRKEAERLRIQAEKEEARANSLKTLKAQEAAAAKAEELKAQAEEATSVTPIVESRIEEVQGVSTRKIWKFEIVDIDKLPREYMLPNEKYIGQIVRVSQGNREIPGVRIYSEDVISSRI